MPDRKRALTVPLPNDRRGPKSRCFARSVSRSRPQTYPPWSLLALLAGWLALSPIGRAQQAGNTPAPDRGAFEIRSGNRLVGTETFEIRASGSGWVANGELQVQGPGGAMVSETASLSLNEAMYPLSYERVQKSPKPGKLVVHFGPGETNLEMTASGGEPYQQSFLLPRNDLAVLDTNFFHHYAFLLRLYDRARGMTQPFNVFIPQEALPGTIHLKYLSREQVAAGPSAVELDHFQAVTDEIELEIWATPEGAIQRIAIPAAGLEVVRQQAARDR
ncbi:MAG TPA: hypothetical protein VNN17_11860 [Terriglobia bacterium]|nr:hypothetical protein [Terriglobia bacterium]